MGFTTTAIGRFQASGRAERTGMSGGYTGTAILKRTTDDGHEITIVIPDSQEHAEPSAAGDSAIALAERLFKAGELAA